MRSVKHPHFTKQDDSDAAAFSLADFGAHFCEQSFDVAPRNVPAGRPSKHQFERALVLPLHAAWYHFQVLRWRCCLAAGFSVHRSEGDNVFVRRSLA
jgi:hypothetical protein